MIAPVPGVSRVLTSPMKFGDVIVPAGTDVDLAIYALHHHPDFWPEHEVSQSYLNNNDMNVYTNIFQSYMEN